MPELESQLSGAICNAISVATDAQADFSKFSRLGGGSINEARLMTLRDGRRFLVKSNASAAPDFFFCEQIGLSTLAAANKIRVPKVICESEHGGVQFLVLEAIEIGREPADFEENLGRQLAELHLESTSDQFGFQHDGVQFDNFIGSSHQPNPLSTDWIDFWGTYRLGFQLRLAEANKVGNRQLQSLGNRLVDRLQQLLPNEHSQPVLIHGDLWSGNYLVDSCGQPVLIDPAPYYADHEAEFGMTALFGGFSQRFYDAYREVVPFEFGFEQRFEIYKLYHLLNHLNLFGNSYLDGCLSILKKYC